MIFPAIKYCYFAMDTVINVIPSADISKTRKITFFSITSKISIFASRNFVRIYLGVVRNHPVQKIGVFLGKMAGKDGKVTFCYISISYLKIEIRQVLRPSQRAGLICFYHENR